MTGVGNMVSMVYELLNRRWKATAKLIFGEEVGELKDYEEWLLSSNKTTFSRKSSLSGKEVAFVFPHYPKSAGTLSLDEVDFNKKFEPLSINDVKDIDSIIGALGERVSYTGDIHLGNSQFVEGSTDVIDSFYIMDSVQLISCKHIAYGYNMEYSNDIFGTMNIGYCNYAIKLSNSGNLARCFELHTCQESSDCYYSHSIYNCKNCMFCFNLRSTNYAIGNLPLPPDKFLSLKKKLLQEMAGDLKTNKRLPNLMEIIGESEPDHEISSRIGQSPPSRQLSHKRPELVEEAFEKATEVLFGRGLKDLENYETWLNAFTRKTKRCKSAISGQEIIVPDQGLISQFPENRLVNEEESMALNGMLGLGPQELSDFSFKNASSRLGKIAFFCPGMNHGKVSNAIESQINIDATNCFRSILNIESKNSAYNYYILQSESAFGCNSIRKSRFVVRCYLSSDLTRAFEVDSSRDCSDIYFSHNCENVRDSMFCFNTKNKNRAIGNSELPREKYSGIKAKVLEDLISELERGHGLDLSIYNIPGKGA